VGRNSRVVVKVIFQLLSGTKEEKNYDTWILTAMRLEQDTVLVDTTPSSYVYGYQHSEKEGYFLLYGRKYLSCVRSQQVIPKRWFPAIRLQNVTSQDTTTTVLFSACVRVAGLSS
jgi:hypothetical protein